MARPPRLKTISYRDAGTYSLTVCTHKRTSYAHLQLFGRPLWQPGYYDRVLRADDDVLLCIAYIVANPLRAGLTDDARAYPFWGSTVYSREEVLDAVAEIAPRRG